MVENKHDTIRKFNQINEYRSVSGGLGKYFKLCNIISNYTNLYIIQFIMILSVIFIELSQYLVSKGIVDVNKENSRILALIIMIQNFLDSCR